VYLIVNKILRIVIADCGTKHEVLEMKNDRCSLSYICLLIIFCFSIFGLPNNVFPWWKSVHQSMAHQAAELMPSASFPPVENPGTYRFSLLLGSFEPDNNRVIDHTNVSECAWMIKKLAKKCEEMIRNGKDWDEILFTMGQTTHYIQDLNCPHHGIGEYREGFHEDFEAEATWGYWKPEKFDGFHHISDYKIFAYNAARFSARYIHFADRLNHRLGEDYMAYRKELITSLWDHSVNDVTDLWLTILKNGFGDEKYEELGFPKQVGFRAKEKLTFPKIKKVAHIGAATCFIATTVYGSPSEKHVLTLRQFRERRLLSNSLGRLLIEIYYSLSPPLAKAVAERAWARTMLRLALTPVVVLVGASLGNRNDICLIFISFITIGSIILFIRRRL
jgi:hypothetical protein